MVNFRALEAENMFDGTDLAILIKVVEAMNRRLENTLYGYFIGKIIAFPLWSIM